MEADSAVDGEGEDPVDRLRAAAADRERARERLDAAGEADLRRLRERCDELRALLSEYEGRATGDGDFAAFIEFQEEIAAFVEELGDLPGEETFDEIDDLLQQRRLTEEDFAAVRERIDGLEERLAPVENWEDATDRYRAARDAVKRRRHELRERIDRLERVARLGDADLDAPVERLRDPIDRYNDAVRERFRAFRDDRPAREVLEYVASTAPFPLVGFRDPPDELLAFVRDHEAGAESIPTLLEYADYSPSKLSHYVDGPRELKRRVASRRTYLRRLDAEPLTIGWPSPPADELRWRCEELTAAVARLDGPVAALREVRALTRGAEYERLRTAAVARAELTDEQRERLRSGAVERELETARAERERCSAALSEFRAV